MGQDDDATLFYLFQDMDFNADFGICIYNCSNFHLKVAIISDIQQGNLDVCDNYLFQKIINNTT